MALGSASVDYIKSEVPKAYNSFTKTQILVTIVEEIELSILILTKLKSAHRLVLQRMYSDFVKKTVKTSLLYDMVQSLKLSRTLPSHCWKQ